MQSPYPQQTALTLKTTEGGAEYEEVEAVPAGGVERILLHRPIGVGELSPAKLIIHFPGVGGNTTADNERMSGYHKTGATYTYFPEKNIRNLALDAGYIVLSSQFGPASRWGNINHRNAAKRHYEWVASICAAGISDVYLIGESMGGLVAAVVALDAQIPNIRAFVGISAAVNLDAAYARPDLSKTIRTAYGIINDGLGTAPGSSYDIQTAASGPGGGNANPCDHGAVEWTGGRTKQYAATGDGQVKPAEHALVFQANCGAGFTEFQLYQAAGGHLAASLYLPPNDPGGILTFFGA